MYTSFVEAKTKVFGQYETTQNSEVPLADGLVTESLILVLYGISFAVVGFAAEFVFELGSQLKH